MSVTYVTEEGLHKMKEVLRQMEIVERPKISQQIAEARDKGDLSENAEYDAAKEAQGILEMRIAKLKEKIASARIINTSKLDDSKVTILSTVKLKNTKNGAVMSYTLVPENEANLKEGKISVDSPIGKGLLGKVEGDIAEINVPNGLMQFEVMAISR
jgi:transcription elongation factor GreA